MDILGDSMKNNKIVVMMVAVLIVMSAAIFGACTQKTQVENQNTKNAENTAFIQLENSIDKAEYEIAEKAEVDKILAKANEEFLSANKNEQKTIIENAKLKIEKIIKLKDKNDYLSKIDELSKRLKNLKKEQEGSFQSVETLLKDIEKTIVDFDALNVDYSKIVQDISDLKIATQLKEIEIEIFWDKKALAEIAKKLDGIEDKIDYLQLNDDSAIENIKLIETQLNNYLGVCQNINVDDLEILEENKKVKAKIEKNLYKLSIMKSNVEFEKAKTQTTENFVSVLNGENCDAESFAKLNEEFSKLNRTFVPLQMMIDMWRDNITAELYTCDDMESLKAKTNEFIEFLDEKVAKIEFTLSEDGNLLQTAQGDKLGGFVAYIPYFDLEMFGLENLNRYEADTFENGGAYLEPNVLVETPTLLHAFLYLQYNYFYDEASKPSNLRQMPDSEDLKIGGFATTMFMTKFWGHDGNLGYEVNKKYPLMKKGIGATADYILLDSVDGVDVVDVFMSADYGFYMKECQFVFSDCDGKILNADETLTVEYLFNKGFLGTPFEENQTPGDFEVWYGTNADLETGYQKAVKNFDGLYKITFDNSGKYYIYAKYNATSTGGAYGSGYIVMPNVDIVTVA